MRHQRSYGIIPLRRQSEGWETLLVQHYAGHWSFPKGHSNPGEQPRQTAERELSEETGLKVVRYLVEQPQEEHYQFQFEGELIEKSVLYFLAEVAGEVNIQPEEIADSRWLPLDQAQEWITFSQAKHICQQVRAVLSLTKKQIQGHTS